MPTLGRHDLGAVRQPAADLLGDREVLEHLGIPVAVEGARADRPLHPDHQLGEVTLVSRRQWSPPTASARSSRSARLGVAGRGLCGLCRREVGRDGLRDVVGQVPVLGHDGKVTGRGRRGPEHLGDAAVGRLAGRQELASRRRRPQQPVPEAVPPQPGLGDRLDQPGVVEAGQRVVDRPAGEPAERLLVELDAEGRRQLRDAQVDAGCPQACREDLVDPRWEHLAGVGIDGAAGQLLEEEGDPASRSTISRPWAVSKSSSSVRRPVRPPRPRPGAPTRCRGPTTPTAHRAVAGW